MDVNPVARIVSDQGIQAAIFTETDALLNTLTREATPQDLILIMSNGGFGGLHGRLLSTLEAKFSG